MASKDETPNGTVNRRSVRFEPQFVELDDERREQIVQLLVELLEHLTDKPTVGIDGGSDEGEAA